MTDVFIFVQKGMDHLAFRIKSVSSDLLSAFFLGANAIEKFIHKSQSKRRVLRNATGKILRLRSE